jgi:transcriptional regulator with XRE-family HTH domain
VSQSELRRLPFTDMHELVVRAVDNGEISMLRTRSGLTVEEVSEAVTAYLRGHGVACTPARAGAIAAKVLVHCSPLIGNSLPAQDDVPVSVGQRIRLAREQARMSRSDLASATGITEAFASYLENDRRRPSHRTMKAIGQAVGRDPEWLYTGSDANVTARVEELLRLAELACENNAHDEADRVLQELGRGVGRPLYQDEQDRWQFWTAYRALAVGDCAAAVELLGPVIRRCWAGKCALPVLRVGQVHLRALINLGNRQGSGTLLLAAMDAGQRTLEMVDPADRDVRWYRLAATSMIPHIEMKQLRPAAQLAESWLAQIPVEQDVASGSAALHWNLGAVYRDLGRPAEALASMERARELHDNTYYAVDGLALQVEYAGILMIARPERVEESIALLEGVRDELFRIAFQPIVSDWSLRRGQVLQLRIKVGWSGAWRVRAGGSGVVRLCAGSG